MDFSHLFPYVFFPYSSYKEASIFYPSGSILF